MLKDTGKVVQIVKGLQNSLFVKEQVELIAQERIAICDTCDFYSPNIKKKGLAIIRPDKYCDVCKCNMYLKTRSLAAQCPIGELHRVDKITGLPKYPGESKWKAITTDAALSEHILEVGLKDEIIDYKTKLQQGKIEEHGNS